MKIAHLSDLHVLDLNGTRWTQFLNKRLTGLANLAGARRNAHPIEIARKLGVSVRDAGAEHVLITGDLTNLSLPSELKAAQEVVQAIGPPEFVTLIPGNHDVYTAGALRTSRFEEAFDGYLPPLAGASGTGRDRYPIARTIAPHVRVYGLSSAIPTPPFFAWGEVGGEQLKRLVDAVAAEPAEVTVRIVLVHHNLHTRGRLAERTAQLRDRAELAAVLRKIRATALLHGHTHEPHQGHLKAGTNAANPGEVLVLGCGSSTHSKPNHPDRARFNIMAVGPTGIDAVVGYGWRSSERRFVLLTDDLLAAAQGRALAL